MTTIFNLSLLFFIGILSDFLLAFSVVEISPDTETSGNSSSTDDRYIGLDGFSAGLTSTGQITAGLTVVLLLLLFFAVGFLAKEWYRTSYNFIIDKMLSKGRLLPRHTDPNVVYGLDGRPNWIDYYGPYEAQDAVDMINTLALTQHRSHYSNGSQNLAMCAIKGRELSSVSHAFENFPEEERPEFKYLRPGQSSDGISWYTPEDNRNNEPEDDEHSVEDNIDKTTEIKDSAEETESCQSPEKDTDENCEDEASKEQKLPPITNHGDVSYGV